MAQPAVLGDHGGRGHGHGGARLRAGCSRCGQRPGEEEGSWWSEMGEGWENERIEWAINHRVTLVGFRKGQSLHFLSEAKQ